MAFQIAWVFKAVDKYSNPAKKINKIVDRMTRNQSMFRRVMIKTGAMTVLVYAKMSRAVKKFGKNFKKNIGRGVIRGMKGLGRAAVTLGKTALVGLTGGFALAIHQGMKFQDSLLELEAVTGLSGEKLKPLTKGAFELGKAFAITGDETLNAFKNIASFAPELLTQPEKLKAVTRASMLLVNAELSLDQSSKALVRSMIPFGIKMSEAETVANQFAAANQAGSVSVVDLGNAAVKSAGAAKTWGLTLSENLAIQQAAFVAGKLSMEAGTAMNAIFLKLATSGEKAYSVQKIGLAGVLENLSKLDEIQLNKLVGVEGFGVTLEMANMRKEIVKFAADINGSTVATDQFEIRSRALSFKLKQLGVTIQEKLVVVFKKLDPLLIKIVDGLSRWIDEISDESINKFVDIFSGGLKSMTNFITSLKAKDMEDFIDTLVEIADAFKYIAQTIVSVKDAIGGIKQIAEVAKDVSKFAVAPGSFIAQAASVGIMNFLGIGEKSKGDIAQSMTPQVASPPMPQLLSGIAKIIVEGKVDGATMREIKPFNMMLNQGSNAATG